MSQQVHGIATHEFNLDFWKIEIPSFRLSQHARTVVNTNNLSTETPTVEHRGYLLDCQSGATAQIKDGRHKRFTTDDVDYALGQQIPPHVVKPMSGEVMLPVIPCPVNAPSVK